MDLLNAFSLYESMHMESQEYFNLGFFKYMNGHIIFHFLLMPTVFDCSGLENSTCQREKVNISISLKSHQLSMQLSVQ